MEELDKNLPAWIGLGVNVILIVIFIINTLKQKETIKTLKDSLEATKDLLKSTNEYASIFDSGKIKEYVAMKEELVLMQHAKVENTKILEELELKIKRKGDELNKEFNTFYGRKIRLDLWEALNKNIIIESDNVSGMSGKSVKFGLPPMDEQIKITEWLDNMSVFYRMKDVSVHFDHQNPQKKTP